MESGEKGQLTKKSFALTGPFMSRLLRMKMLLIDVMTQFVVRSSSLHKDFVPNVFDNEARKCIYFCQVIATTFMQAIRYYKHADKLL